MLKFIAPLLTVSCVSLSAISASATDIIDQGHFFSEAALKSANQTISELEQKYRHQIHIETYATVPEGKAEAVAKMSKAEKDAFFVSWIKDRAKATNANGLFLLICKNPSHVHPAVGERLVKQGFKSDARDRVVHALLDSFRSQQYDEGLQHALTQVRTEFSKLGPANAASRTGTSPVTPLPHANRPPTAFPKVEREPAPAGRQTDGGWGGMVMIGLLIVGGLFLFSLVSRMFNRGMGGAPGMGVGGGGFGSGLLGGLFGAMAGNWLYDSFSGHHGQAHAGDHHTGFGGDSSASGFGSGDFGGNDFGSGADFGGGGDFGSGGDFGGGGDF